MFKFKISTLDDSDALCNYWATKCVSLLGPEYKDQYKTTRKRLVVYFDDIEGPPKPGSKYIAPTKPQIGQVFEFTKSLNDKDKLLVHCKAGISRSTAMLIGILCQHGLTPEEAFDAVRKVRPQLWPNNLIIKFVDELLTLNGILIKIVSEFKKKHKHRLFTESELIGEPSIRRFITIVEQGGYIPQGRT